MNVFTKLRDTGVSGSLLCANALGCLVIEWKCDAVSTWPWLGFFWSLVLKFSNLTSYYFLLSSIIFLLLKVIDYLESQLTFKFGSYSLISHDNKLDLARVDCPVVGFSLPVWITLLLLDLFSFTGRHLSSKSKFKFVLNFPMFMYPGLT